MQLHLTGGEPLARKDLELLAARARELGLYANLVTSGIPLTRERLERLAARGLDHVQVSIQSSRAALADEIAGYAGHAKKLEVMRWVKALGLPLTMNVVLHRANLDEIDELVALAEDVGARSPRAREHAVPRLGAREPRRAPARRASRSSAPPRRRRRIASGCAARWTCSS